MGAQALEERLEPRGAFLGAHAGRDLEAMIEPLVLPDGKQSVDRACFGIRTSIDDAAHTRMHQRPGAHGARLERHVHGRIVEAPIRARPSGFADGDHLRVRSRIRRGFSEVVPACHDRLLANDHAPYGDLAFFGREVGLREGLGHEGRIIHGFSPVQHGARRTPLCIVTRAQHSK